MLYETLVAPTQGYLGVAPVKPWDYKVTVAIPHLDTLPQLALALELWRCQTIRPYFIVVDTGTPDPGWRELEVFREEDCEVHYVRGHGYRHPSAPVGVALDLAQAICRTEFLVHTHTDLFPRSRELLAYLLLRCGVIHPVCGWRMSPRDTSTSPTRDEWKRAVSHTCTILHMPTVHRMRLSWCFEGYYARRPEETGHFGDWPDTESAFAVAMQEAGVEPVFLGEELNWQRQVNEWWDHPKSYGGLKNLARGGKLGPVALYARALGFMRAAEGEARARLAEWQRAGAGQWPAQAPPPAAARQPGG